MEEIKYDLYEVVESDNGYNNAKIIGIMSAKTFKKIYGNRKILSVKNYDDTHTTSIILYSEELEEQLKNGY